MIISGSPFGQFGGLWAPSSGVRDVLTSITYVKMYVTYSFNNLHRTSEDLNNALRPVVNIVVAVCDDPNLDDIGLVQFHWVVLAVLQHRRPTPRRTARKHTSQQPHLRIGRQSRGPYRILRKGSTGCI